MKSVITFRLRKDLDADLIQLGVDENSLADLCRNGLRLMLGIQTAKQVEVKEMPIVTQKPRPLPGTGKGWINPNQRRVRES